MTNSLTIPCSDIYKYEYGYRTDHNGWIV